MSEAIPMAETPQPISKPSFTTVFYNALFNPFTQYNTVVEEKNSVNQYFLFGLCFILFVSAMTPILKFIESGGDNVQSLLLQVPFQAILGALVWLTLGNMVSMMSYAMTGEGRVKNFLILSAFASLPWIFNAPLILLKEGLGITGSLIGTVGDLALTVWSLVLFSMAIAVNYRLPIERVMIILGLLCPFALSLWLAKWIVTLFSNLLFQF